MAAKGVQDPAPNDRGAVIPRRQLPLGHPWLSVHKNRPDSARFWADDAGVPLDPSRNERTLIVRAPLNPLREFPNGAVRAEI